MMELLLNLAWLLVATTAIVLWLCHRRRGASLFLQSVALGCALAVLFPAISATDDLHAAQLAVEASDVARRMLRSMNTVNSSSAVDWLHFLPALLLLALALTWRGKRLGAISEPRILLRSAESLPLSEGRAPPVPLSA